MSFRYHICSMSNIENRFAEGADSGQPQAITTDEAVNPGPNGTVPLDQTPAVLDNATSGDQGSAKKLHSRPADVVTGGLEAEKGVPGRPPPLPPYHDAAYTATRPAINSARVVNSPTGGMQVTLDGAGSWSDLARQDATLPADANATTADEKNESSGGVFSFFRSKKGRGHSPKPKERGVLGKEGARVVIG